MDFEDEGTTLSGGTVHEGVRKCVEVGEQGEQEQEAYANQWAYCWMQKRLGVAEGRLHC